MAKYRPSGLIQSISGSVGDVTFSHWRGISTISKRVRRGRSLNTLPQVRIKEAFSILSRSWRGMSFRDWALWEDYAKIHRRLKTYYKSGLVYTIGNWVTGKNAYMSVNSVLMVCGFEPIKKPILEDVCNPPLVLTDLINLGEYSDEIRFNVWLPNQYIARCVSQIWIRKIEKQGYSHIWGIVSVSSSKTEVVIDKIRVRRDGKVLEKGFKELGDCKLFIQMRTVAENGKFSMPSQIYRIQVIR